ncbi:MAG: RHS repeat-associated core domain-containing protein [Archangium sp.]
MNIDTGASFGEFRDIFLGSAPPFVRQFNSQPTAWANGLPLAGVPTPFGSSPDNSNSLEWWHSYLSFVHVRSQFYEVRTADGSMVRFAICASAPCWAAPVAVNASVAQRLRRTSTGFELTAADGQKWVFTAKFVSTTGDRYFPTEIWSSRGAQVAAITYAAPSGLTCTTGGSGSTSGTPYVATIATTESQLAFNYSSLTKADGGTECVISSVSRALATGAATVATFGYSVDGGTNRPGRLYWTSFLGGVDSYSYPDGGFSVSSSGVQKSDHLYTSARVTSDAFTGGNLSISYSSTPGSCASGSNCCGATPRVRTVSDLVAGIGNGSTSDPGFATSYSVLDNYGQRLDPRLYEVTDSCSTTYACSPGTVRFDWACTSGSQPGQMTGRKDKRDNWEVFVWSVGDAGASGLRPERTAVLSGASAPDGGGFLEKTLYGYSYGPDGQQRIATQSAVSVLDAGALATTTNQYDSDNRLKGVIKSGLVMDLSGAVSMKHVATFYRKQWDCSGTPSGSADSANRTLQIDGPCFVSSSSATSCSSTYPVRRFEFWPAEDGGSTRSGRVRYVSDYPLGCAQSALTTEFAAYDVSGEPTEIVDVNGVHTFVTVTNGRVTSRQVGGSGPTTTFTYDGEHLTAVGFPEGNYEVYCYRSGTSSSGCVGGTLTNQLQWKAKSATSVSADGNWSEREEYEYWPDGTLKQVQTKNPSGVRTTRKFAADAHRRQTLNTAGSAAQITSASAFDGADNRIATGQAYNSPPVFCRATGGSDGSSGALSRLCAQLGYDRANRLRQLDLFPDPTSNTPVRVCIDRNTNGEVSRVTTGCSISDTCNMDDGQSTCASAAGLSNDYLMDDFGNVTQVTLSGTDNGSGGRGVARFEYDAFGNVARQQSEAQRSAGTARNVVFTYDQIGRRTLWQEIHGATTYQVLKWSYDADSTSIPNPPSGCGAQPTNTMGRLRAVSDPVFTRHFRYDDEGRVTKEIRNLGDNSSCNPHPNLGISYSANGNVTSLAYGFGRTVTYTFGTGASIDRVASISTNFSSDAGVQQLALITNVEWEPYGALRTYRFAHDAGVTVEYELGAASSAPASRCPSGAMSETKDETGRLRSLRAWSSSREVYRRTYTWRADQIERIDTCYLGGADGGEYLSEIYAADAGSGLGYDGLQRLVGGVGTGNWTQRKYAYDSRGNITSIVGDDGGTITATFDTSSANRKDWLTSFGVDSWNKVDLTYDRDGRVVSLAGPVDLSGTAPTVSLDFVSAKFDDGSGGTAEIVFPGADTVMRGVTVSAGGNADGGTTSLHYNYAYDFEKRRLAKLGPTSSEVYLYDLGHQLLEVVDPDYGFTDEYIYLGGQPVAAFRANGGYDVRSSDCGSVECGVRFVIVDHIGKPVLTLDSSGRIAGVGEYDPYGTMNRVAMGQQSAHPYSRNSAAAVSYPVQQRTLTGLSSRFRAHFPLMDTDQSCGGQVRDGVKVYSIDGGTLYETVGGHARGDVWTQWWSGTNLSGVTGLSLSWATDDGNCYAKQLDGTCTNACPQSAGNGPQYKGFVLREFEYQRFETGAAEYFPPLRFPGQYWDAETDLYENWHRFYWAPGGRYLTPEPMMQWPSTITHVARAEGRVVATYAYAHNNPIANVDETGLMTRQYRRDGKGSEIVRLLEAPLRQGLIEQCRKEAEQNEKDCVAQDKACQEPAPLPKNPSVADLKQREEVMIQVMAARERCIKGANCEYEACLAGATSASGTADYMKAWSSCMRRP